MGRREGGRIGKREGGRKDEGEGKIWSRVFQQLYGHQRANNILPMVLVYMDICIDPIVSHSS